MSAECLVAILANADFTPANLSGVNDKRPSMYVKPFTPVLLVGVSFKSPFSNPFFGKFLVYLCKGFIYLYIRSVGGS